MSLCCYLLMGNQQSPFLAIKQQISPEFQQFLGFMPLIKVKNWRNNLNNLNYLYIVSKSYICIYIINNNRSAIAFILSPYMSKSRTSNMPEPQQELSYMPTINIPPPNDQKNKKEETISYASADEPYAQPEKFCKIFGMLMIVCICPLYAGANIFLSFSATFQIYQEYYNFSNYPLFTSNIISGIVPVGAIFGSIWFPVAARRFGKINLVFFILPCTVFFSGLTLVPVFEVLVIGRFFLGVLSAWQNVIAVLLIRDLSPLQYRALFRAMFYAGRAIGLTLTLLIGIIFPQINYVQFCFINLTPLYISIIQSILFRLFITINPAEIAMKEQGMIKLRQYYSNFYSQSNVDKAVQNCIKEFKKMEYIDQQVHKNKSQAEKQEATKIYDRLEKLSLTLSFQASSLRQLCGVDYVGPYTVFVFLSLKYSNPSYGPLYMNCLLVLSSICGMYICHRFPRRILLLLGAIGTFVATLIMAIFNLNQNYVGVLVGQIIFMIFAGSMLQPVCWAYPGEINYVYNLPLSNIASWGCGSMIASFTVVQNSYPVFFFFSSCLFINLILFIFTSKQVKNIAFRSYLTLRMKQAYEQLQRRKYKALQQQNLKQDLITCHQTQRRSIEKVEQVEKN